MMIMYFHFCSLCKLQITTYSCKSIIMIRAATRILCCCLVVVLLTKERKESKHRVWLSYNRCHFTVFFNYYHTSFQHNARVIKYQPNPLFASDWFWFLTSVCHYECYKPQPVTCEKWVRPLFYQADEKVAVFPVCYYHVQQVANLFQIIEITRSYITPIIMDITALFLYNACSSMPSAYVEIWLSF